MRRKCHSNNESLLNRILNTEEELEKLFKGKEPEDLSIEELEKIIPMVKDGIVKRNLIDIYRAKKQGCKINELPLEYDEGHSDINEFFGDIPTPFDD